MKPFPPLIVTGMHRSGTSFVASLLAAWNVRMGDAMLAGDRGNPAGYFEDLDFLNLNRRILVASTPPEAGHRDWGWTENGRFEVPRPQAWRDEARAVVAARDQIPGPWGWKDPRTSMLLDFWDDVSERRARFLLLYRHPWEVADSMLRTGADIWLTKPSYPARIWTEYNRRILDFHRRHRDRTLLVSTNRLLRDSDAFVTILKSHFGIEADAETIASLRSKHAFVSLPDSDPLPRLWRVTNGDAIELLGALDDSADLGNDRSWSATPTTSRRPSAKPRLSVIIPCHDDGDYLIDAVASVERNTPAGTELIIVDDGSTSERTLQVLDALREAAYQVITQSHAGLSAARNRGIAASSGDYLLPLDADNRLLPGFAAEAMAVLDTEKTVGVVYGDRREFGGRTGDIAVPEFDLPRMLWSNYIDACAVIRREVWNDVGGYDPELTDWEDWDFWLGVGTQSWRFFRLPRTTFEYRIRPDSLQQRFLRRNDYVSVLDRVYEKHRNLIAAHAPRVLIAAHVERRQLFADTAALRTSRDQIQIEIDRLAIGAQEQSKALKEIIAARDNQLASMRLVLKAREKELAALRSPRPGACTEGAPSRADPGEQALTEASRVFTIVARNYLAYARVLAASLMRHNPSARLNVIVLDDPDRRISAEASFDLFHADELPFDLPSDFFTMAAIYDVTELATAVKPWAFEYFFRHGARVVIYLDPDIEVFASLGALELLAEQHGMILTPHITEPLPQDGRRPDERDLLLAGIYNLGFMALSADAAGPVLPWWRERLRRNCLNDPSQGMFVDQRWIDFAPALFEPWILKDPGYNVAYWNLPHRVLTQNGDRIEVNGQALRFFHYSGFSPVTPHLLSRHQHDSLRIRLSAMPLLNTLCARYAAALEKAGFARCSSLPYGFATTDGDLPLDARVRSVLRRTYLEDEGSGHTQPFPNPFTAEGRDDVVQRLLRPSPYASGVPGYLGEIWSERPDLRLAFPLIASTDAERFLDWVRTQGVLEHDIPAQLIPAQSSDAGTMAATRRKVTPGVNVYGYVYAESGTGQIVRSVVAALASEGIPYAVIPFTHTVSRQERVFADHGTAAPSFDTNLICVNADQVPLFFAMMRGQLLPGVRNIGLWAWEVEDLPHAMAASEYHLDEVWGISRFTATALARQVTKAVHAFPLPVVVPEIRRRTRAELGMPEGFLFLFCFDHDSVFRRKNPLAVVAAFRQAFASHPGVVLYIKTTNADRHAADSEELHAAARDCGNIVIRDAYLSSDDYFSMLDRCGCYVSLHRSEGFGLTVAEAMALGKPVISTAYSATLEFANESNSFPVPAEIVEVGDDAPPYPPRSRWAEPDIAAAAAQMSRVYGDPHGAAVVGARARADIATLHGPQARGPLLRRLLDQNRHTRLGSPPPRPGETNTLSQNLEMIMERIQPSSAEPGDFFTADAMAVESLLGSPQPGLPSRMAGIVAPLRRLVLRCIRVYWVQQLAVDRGLLAAMRTLRRESRAEEARIRRDLAKLTAEVRALREEAGVVEVKPEKK